MVSIFKDRSVPAVFFLLVLCLGLHSFFFVAPPTVVISPAEGLMYYVLQPLANLPPLAITILYFVIVLLQALRINNVLNDARMFQKAPFTPALSYILITAVWPPCNNISSALVANSLLIWLLFRFLKLFNISQPKALVYNIGLISGLTVLLYYPAAGIILVAFIAVSIARAFRLNEWMVLLLGIVTPVYFWCGWLFLNGQTGSLKSLPGIIQLHAVSAPIKLTAVAFGAVVLLLLAGIGRWQSANRAMLIHARKMWLIVFFMLVCLLPASFIIKNSWPNALLPACVPAAALAANAFLSSKKFVSEILFWLMVGAVVYVNWAMI